MGIRTRSSVTISAIAAVATCASVAAFANGPSNATETAPAVNTACDKPMIASPTPGGAGTASSDDGYPRNSHGLTYGTGDHGSPDLEAAIGHGGQSGYVSLCDTLAAYNPGPIPLYDQEGNRIGTFDLVQAVQVDTAGPAPDAPRS